MAEGVEPRRCVSGSDRIDPYLVAAAALPTNRREVGLVLRLLRESRRQRQEDVERWLRMRAGWLGRVEAGRSVELTTSLRRQLLAIYTAGEFEVALARALISEESVERRFARLRESRGLPVGRAVAGEAVCG